MFESVSCAAVHRAHISTKLKMGVNWPTPIVSGLESGPKNGEDKYRCKRGTFLTDKQCSFPARTYL